MNIQQLGNEILALLQVHLCPGQGDAPDPFTSWAVRLHRPQPHIEPRFTQEVARSVFMHSDIDALWEKARDRVRVESPPRGTRKFVILDPDGMCLAFVDERGN